MSAPAHRGRRDNGLHSEAFSPVADLDPRLGDHLLDVLGLREIPAYVEPAPVSAGVAAERLFVDSALTAQAHGVLRDLANELGINIAGSGERLAPRPGSDLLDGVDTEAEFAAIIAHLPDLNRPLVDPHAGGYFVLAEVHHDRDDSATHEADDVEHFIPPPPPPIPRLTAATVAAVLVTLSGIVVLAMGGQLGLTSDLPLPLGVVLILFGCGLLFRRLRPDSTDDPDDGAVV